MKKSIFILLIGLSVMSGCASTDIDRVTTLEKELSENKTLTERAIRNLAIELQQISETPSSDIYETARLKTRIQIVDRTFTQDIRELTRKLTEANKKIEEQEKRIKALESNPDNAER